MASQIDPKRTYSQRGDIAVWRNGISEPSGAAANIAVP
jgi:hypothetical protein